MNRSSILLVLFSLLMLGGGIGYVFFVRRERLREEKGAFILIMILQRTQDLFKEQDYDKNGIQDYWIRDIAGLAVDGNSGSSGVDADATPGRSGSPPVPFRGFLATAVRRGAPGTPEDRSHYAICVYPAHFGSRGRYTYLFDDTGVIYSRNLEGKPVYQWPTADELARDWWH